MKQKTKTRLATLGLVSTSAVGLGCIGFGIYAISQMRHPYLNQWVDFQEEKKYRPIVNPIDETEIAAILHKDLEDLNEQDICDFYLNKIIVTPEVFVEDFIETKYGFFIEQIQGDNFIWDKYIIRMSDVTFSYEENENGIEYFIHLRWDQDIDGHVLYQNEHNLVAKWAIVLDKVPISITKDAANWHVKVDLSSGDWTGQVEIKKVDGFGEQTECELTSIDKEKYDKILVDDYFKNFSFDSHYLSEVNIN